MDLVSLQAIYHYKIAQSFSGEASYEQISRACGLDETTLRRIMRHAMTNYIFKEHDNVVSHTAASKSLHDNPMLHAWVGMICEESWPAAARVRQPKVRQTRGSTNVVGRPLMPSNAGQDLRSLSIR